MHQPTYRQALSHAWHIVWHHKILWIFGLLSLFVGQFGANDFIGKIWMITQKTLVVGKFHGWSNLDLKAEIAIVWIAAICLGLLILILAIAVIAQGALIVGSAESLRNHKINFNKAWHRATEHFWALLSINILRALAMLIIVIITGLIWTLLSFGHLPLFWSNTLSVVLISVALLFGLSVSSWSIYTLCYSVLDGKGATSAIKRGWQLFRHHLLVSLELNALLFLVLMVVFAFFYGLFFLSAAPSLIIWLIAGITGYAKLVTLGLILWAGLLFLLIALIGAIFNAFSTSAWTYLFLKMHNEGVISRIFHYFAKIVKR